MKNTREHITIRIPKELLSEIDVEAARLDRSRAWVVLGRLNGNRNDDIRAAGRGETISPKRSGNRTAMPKVWKSESDEKLLHPMQPLRPELGERNECVPASSHEGHRTFIAGTQHWCSTCKAYY